MKRLIAAATAMLVLSGCAVRPVKFDNSDGNVIDDSIVTSAECRTSFEPGYCRAVELADGYRRGYLRSASRRAATREALGLIAIPAAAAALYYGLSGREIFNDRILRLSVGGAGAYAAGQWSLKPAREQAYIAGAQAMTCAVISSLQNVVPTAVAGKDIVAVLDDLHRKIAALQTTVQGGRISDATRDQAVAELNAANAVAGDLAYLRGETLRAGAMLSARVAMIDTQVRELANRSAPTLDSLSGLLGGLQGYAKTFGSDRIIAAPAAPAVAAANAASEDGGTGVVRIQRDLSQEATALRQIEALARAVADARVYLRYSESARTQFESVAACAPKGTKTFQILPDSGNVQIKATESYSLTVTDRIGFPVVSLGGTPNAVTLEPVQIGRADDQYVVVVKTQAVTATVTGPVLSLRSANGLEGRDIAITVVPAAAATPPPAPPTPPAARPAGEARNPAEQAFLDAPTDLFAVQCLVGADPDCRIGPATRTAIATYRTSHGLGTGDHIDQPLIDAGRDMKAFNDGFDCKVVAATPDERRKACKKTVPTP